MNGELTYDELNRIANNPSRAISLVLDRTAEAFAGKRVKFESSSHPFVRALDTICSESAGLINRLGDVESRLYREHARTPSDLFRHMSDYEFYGLFGNPSHATMRFSLPVSEIRRLAVDYEEQSGTVINRYRKLTMPKDTIVEVYGIPFSIVHAIEFRLMEAGHVQVVYDSKTQHPYFNITTNSLERRTVNILDQEYLYVDIPVKQLRSETKRKIAITPSAGLKETYNFKDKLFGVRAWLKPTNGEIRELRIAYNNQVFNQNEVTLTVDVDQDNQRFVYAIPETFINNGKGVGTLTLVVYTTRGEYEQDLSTLRSQTHTVKYLDHDYDKNQLGKYSAPMREVNNSAWEIQTAVTGGSSPRSFLELKNETINNARRQSIPISENQISNYLNAYGYSATKLIDVYTNRLYQVTRELPTYTDADNSVKSVNAYIAKVMYSIDELRNSGVVYDNEKRITMPPGTVFDVTETGTRVLPKTQIDAIKQMTTDERLDYVNGRMLVYSPFHTVLDVTGGTVKVRPYLLDNPKYDNQNFLYEKETLGIELSVQSIKVEHRNRGYRIIMVTRGDDAYRQMSDDKVGAQLYFTPADSRDIATLKGTVLGRNSDNDRIWSFELDSNFDLDQRDLMTFTNMFMFSRPIPSVKAELKSDIRVLFLVEGSEGEKQTEQDLLIDPALYPTNMTCLIEVGYDLILGKALNNLYHRAHPVLGDAQYKRYAEDVPETWPEDTFKRHENGDYVFEDGRLVLEHRAGDIMLNEDGKPIILHYKNSLVKDENDQPIKLVPNQLKYYMDFVCFDGNYHFSNDEYDLNYARQTKEYITDVVVQDMANFESQMRDKTDLMFAPKVKLGLINVVMNSQFETKVRADLSFNVVFYLTPAGIRSDTVRPAIKTITSNVINQMLKNTTVSNNEIVRALKDALPSDVVDLRLNALANDAEIDVVSNLDTTTSFSVRKRLENTGDGVSSVKESISYAFLPHYKNK
ncbi:phage protein [Vibrio phage pTD1]|uniref:Phage protein n=1 Tax=Vibrio phage pTD1 TaxID=1938577 RepID=A0A1Q2U2W0_9CAUD|nr:phage protein [Vibrio phage pTD1]BAW98306.1 phage protein [Vibrio phage pTD1]